MFSQNKKFSYIFVFHFYSYIGRLYHFYGQIFNMSKFRSAWGWMLLTLMPSVQQQVNITCVITVKVRLGVREENDESHQIQQQLV